MKKFTEKNLKNQSGFTLIEMALSIIIVGLVLGAGAEFYGQYIKQQAVDTTSSNIVTASSKLEQFQAKFGRLPCPAPLNVARTDATYGTENCAAAAVALGAGTCAGGICVEQSIRTTGLNVATNENLVLVGAVPFRTIQIDENKTFDGYDARMVYAVSYAAITDTTYNNHKGAISIRDSNNRPRTPVDISTATTDGTALYVVLSHGEDRVGAYSNIGTLVKPCVAGTQESENCNTGFETGTIAAPANSIYKSMAQSIGANANYFDDYLAYGSKTTDQTWRRTTADNDNIQDTSPNFIGVGLITPTAELNITSTAGADTLRVYGTDGSNGKIITSEICDETGANCFPTLAIAGTNSTPGEGMKCTPDPVTGGQRYMVKIANGIPVCHLIETIKCPTAANPAATVLFGINGDGSPNCIAPPVISCPTQIVDVCTGSSDPQTFTIPPGAQNAVYTAPNKAGLCRIAKYRCNGTNWEEYGSTGLCTTPAPTTKNVACSTAINNGSPSWAWSGTAIQSTQASCTGSTVTYDVSGCSCKVNSSGGTKACPSPYGGSYSTTTKSECYGQTPATDGIAPEPSATKQTFTTPRFVPTVDLHVPAITPATGDSSVCKCAKSTRMDFDWCQTGFKRKSSPTPATFTSPAASWPSDDRGKYRKITVDTITCSETNDTWNDTNCECDTKASYAGTQTDCSIVTGGTACNEPDLTSSVQWGGNWYPIGYDVKKTERDPLDSCTSKTTPVQTGVCRAKTFTWIQTGSTGTQYDSSNKPSRVVGNGCTCSDTSSGTKPCRQSDPSDTQTYSCQCK